MRTNKVRIVLNSSDVVVNIHLNLCTLPLRRNWSMVNSCYFEASLMSTSAEWMIVSQIWRCIVFARPACPDRIVGSEDLKLGGANQALSLT